jgi:hypothetical protein
MALDLAARQGLGNGAFEESEEEGSVVVDEFFPVEEIADGGGEVPTPVSTPANSLADKLEQRVRRSPAVLLNDPALS